MKISYGLTVCNEHDELNNLLNYLSDKIDNEDEIIVVYDQNRVTDDVMNILNSFTRENYNFYPFNYT
jgi:hypothetical protein